MIILQQNCSADNGSEWIGLAMELEIRHKSIIMLQHCNSESSIPTWKEFTKNKFASFYGELGTDAYLTAYYLPLHLLLSSLLSDALFLPEMRCSNEARSSSLDES